MDGQTDDEWKDGWGMLGRCMTELMDGSRMVGG